MNTVQTLPFSGTKRKNNHVAGLRKLFGSILEKKMVPEQGINRLNRFYRRHRIPLDEIGNVRDEAFLQAARGEILDRAPPRPRDFPYAETRRRTRYIKEPGANGSGRV